MSQIELNQCCENCLGDGIVVRNFYRLGNELKCPNCETIVGSIDIDGDALDTIPETSWRPYEQ